MRRCAQTESYEERSERLNGELLRIRPEELGSFFERHREEFITDPRPFADYMRRKIDEKGLLRQNVFLAADLSEGYGYKLLSEEKRTRQRDTILRLCLAAGLRPEELREALILYGMAPLHARFLRDAVLLAALGSRVYELSAVNRLLTAHGQAPLVRDYE